MLLVVDCNPSNHVLSVKYPLSCLTITPSLTNNRSKGFKFDQIIQQPSPPQSILTSSHMLPALESLLSSCRLDKTALSLLFYNPHEVLTNYLLVMQHLFSCETLSCVLSVYSLDSSSPQRHYTLQRIPLESLQQSIDIVMPHLSSILEITLSSPDFPDPRTLSLFSIPGDYDLESAVSCNEVLHDLLFNPSVSCVLVSFLSSEEYLENIQILQQSHKF